MLKYPIKSFLPKGHNNTMQLHRKKQKLLGFVCWCLHMCMSAHTHFKEMQNRQKVPVNQL